MMISLRFFYPALILLLFAQPLSAQEKKRSGKFTQKNADGSTVKGRYKDDQRTGEWRYFDKDDRLFRTENYSKNQLNGKFMEVRFDSSFVITGVYSDGKRKGEWKKNAADKTGKPGQPLSEENYNYGKLHGRRRVWHANGKLKEESNYFDGKLDGTYATWDEEGRRCLSGSYLKDELHGEWKVYAGQWKYSEMTNVLYSDLEEKEIDASKLPDLTDYDGPVLEKHKLRKIFALGPNLLYSIEYRNNAKHGWWRSYFPDGKVEQEMRYVNGLLDGPARKYSANGTLVFETNFINEKEEGLRRRWSEKGELLSEERFMFGVLHGAVRKYKSLDDEPCYRGVHINGEADSTWIFYYPSGVKMAEKSYVRSVPRGEYKEYDTFGNLIQKGQYANGVPDGEWTTYYSSGAKRSTYSFKSGNITGWHRKWHENGQVMLEQVFPATKENPLPRVYDEKGKEMKPGSDEYANVAFELPGDYLVNISSVDPAVVRRERERRAANMSGALEFAEVMPEFPGGTNAMMEFLKRNIRYPQDAKESGLQGTVYVRFIVERDGRIVETQIRREPGGGKSLSKEAIRVIKSMPRWRPARQGGVPVRCYMTLPVRFKLN